MKSNLPKIKGYCKDCKYFHIDTNVKMNPPNQPISLLCWCSCSVTLKNANDYCSEFIKKEEK